MMTDKMLEAGCVKENYYEAVSYTHLDVYKRQVQTCPYGCQHMISFYNIQIIYVIQTTTQCVCFTVFVYVITFYLSLQKLKANYI